MWMAVFMGGPLSLGDRTTWVGVVGVDCCGGFRGGLGVDEVAQFLRWLEEGHLLGRDVDLGAGFWVSADSRVSLARAEAAEATDFYFVARLEGAYDGVEEYFDDDFSIAAG